MNRNTEIITCCGEGPLLDALREHRLDSVSGAFEYHGGQDMVKPNLANRRRTRLSITDSAGRTHELYLKRYDAESASRAIRRSVSGIRFAARPRSQAMRELESINLVCDAGVPTMEPVICGRQGGSLGSARSYIIVSAVPGESLEKSIAGFFDRYGLDSPQTSQLTRRMAELARRLHAAGLAHRDLYTSHIFLDDRDGRMELYLIDLARVFRPRWRKFRWQVKDLAQIRYSMPEDWASHHWEEFLRMYLGEARHEELPRWRSAVAGKAGLIRRRDERRKLKAGGER